MTEVAAARDLSSIEEIENLWIPMPDGVRLAARVWRPKSADLTPVPALLEYLPYRKRDFMRSRDEPIHRYYALAGYASLRVDLRGTGDSEGVIFDEYSPTEHQDALSILSLGGLLGAAGGDAAGGMDIGALAGQLVGGGVGGLVVQTIVGMLKNKFMS